MFKGHRCELLHLRCFDQTFPWKYFAEEEKGGCISRWEARCLSSHWGGRGEIIKLWEMVYLRTRTSSRRRGRWRGFDERRKGEGERRGHDGGVGREHRARQRRDVLVGQRLGQQAPQIASTPTPALLLPVAAKPLLRWWLHCGSRSRRRRRLGSLGDSVFHHRSFTTPPTTTLAARGYSLLSVSLCFRKATQPASIAYFGPRSSLPHACGAVLVNKRHCHSLCSPVSASRATKAKYHRSLRESCHFGQSIDDAHVLRSFMTSPKLRDSDKFNCKNILTASWASVSSRSEFEWAGDYCWLYYSDFVRPCGAIGAVFGSSSPCSVNCLSKFQEADSTCLSLGNCCSQAVSWYRPKYRSPRYSSISIWFVISSFSSSSQA